MSEKGNLEVAAAKIFCKCYENLTGKHSEFLNQNLLPRPDTTCVIDGHIIDLEIAHVYGSDIDAQRLLDRKRRVPISINELAAQRMIPLSLRLPLALNNILRSKSDKKYESNDVWLVIRNAYSVWDRSDFIAYYSEVQIPVNHPFSEIWLICDSRGRTGLLKI